MRAFVVVARRRRIGVRPPQISTNEAYRERAAITRKISHIEIRGYLRVRCILFSYRNG